MSQATDIEYFRKRAAEERQRATEAVDVCIARVHAEMADRYRDLVDASRVG